MMDGRRAVIITDENVWRHHGSTFPAVLDTIVVPAGEASKSLEKAGELLRRLVALELDRSSLVIGIGGGVVTDLTGFVACTFLRGISFGFVATTVLAQVDAAIGGKNGVNLDGYKNLVGIIRQPSFVLNDTSTLSTLPRDETVNGLAEVIKSGLIADRALFERLEDAVAAGDPLQQLDMGAAISAAAAVKVDVVNRDVFEKNERRHLNFGHTLAHALEKLMKIPHGFAVAAGMVAAARISKSRGMLTAQEADRVQRVIEGFGLPVSVPFDPAAAMDAIRRDKKRDSDRVNFVLLRGLGQAEVVPIPLDELTASLNSNL